MELNRALRPRPASSRYARLRASSCTRLITKKPWQRLRPPSAFTTAAGFPQKFFEHRKAIEQSLTAGMELGMPLHGECIARTLPADRFDNPVRIGACLNREI